MLNEYGKLTQVILRHARDAYGNQAQIDRWWRRLNYPASVDFDAALAEYDAFARRLEDMGAEIIWLDADDRLTPDSIYVRDAALSGPNGLILCQMGKPDRQGEVEVLAARPPVTIAGQVDGYGFLEGGDFIWFDEANAAVADGYRSNREAAGQLSELFGDGVTVASIPLPHYKGPDDVFHLMSILSPVDRDLAVAFSPLMPVPFRRWLLDRGIELVEVPEEEFESMGCNVLALEPRHCLMLEGNPETRRRLAAAGCQVETYRGVEISQKGAGGPTCLTRPVKRL